MMKSNVLNLITILVLSAAFQTAQASTYGDMQTRAREYKPEFYEKNLKGIETGTEFSDVPMAEDSEKAFEEAIRRVQDLADNDKASNVDEIATRFLTGNGLKELELVRRAIKEGSLETFIGGEPLTLDRVLAAAVALSPAVAGAEDNYRASLNRYEQIVFLDQLLNQYLDFTESIDTLVGSKRNKRMVQMSFPFPGMVSIKGELVQKDVEIARVEYEKTVRDVLTDLKLAASDYQYFDVAASVTEKNLELAKGIERAATELYGVGKAAYTDLVKMSIRVDKLETMLETQTRMKNAAGSRIIETAGLPYDLEIAGITEDGLPQLPDLEKLYELSLNRRQELRSMELMLDRMDLMIEMAGRKVFPDYSLGLSYFQDQEIRSVGTQGMMPSFPVRPMEPGAKPDFANENAYIQEMRDRRSGMSANLDDMRNRTKAMVRTYFERYAASLGTAKVYLDSILVKSKNSYEASLTAYTSGAVGFIDLLDAHRQLLDQTLAYEDSKRTARESLAFLEKTIGQYTLPEKMEDLK
ncbi:MAG: TolC family protein [bacterium]